MASPNLSFVAQPRAIPNAIPAVPRSRQPQVTLWLSAVTDATADHLPEPKQSLLVNVIRYFRSGLARIAHPEWGAYEMAVAWYIAAHYDKRGENEAFPGIESISRGTLMSPRTVRRAIKNLSAADGGLYRVVRHNHMSKGAKGDPTSNHYYVAVPVFTRVRGVWQAHAQRPIGPMPAGSNRPPNSRRR